MLHVVGWKWWLLFSLEQHGVVLGTWFRYWTFSILKEPTAWWCVSLYVIGMSMVISSISVEIWMVLTLETHYSVEFSYGHTLSRSKTVFHDIHLLPFGCFLSYLQSASLCFTMCMCWARMCSLTGVKLTCLYLIQVIWAYVCLNIFTRTIETSFRSFYLMLLLFFPFKFFLQPSPNLVMWSINWLKFRKLWRVMPSHFDNNLGLIPVFSLIKYCFFKDMTCIDKILISLSIGSYLEPTCGFLCTVVSLHSLLFLSSAVLYL